MHHFTIAIQNLPICQKLVKCLSNVCQCLSKEGKDNGSQKTVRLERAAQPATTRSGAVRAGCQASGRTYVCNRQFIQMRVDSGIKGGG